MTASVGIAGSHLDYVLEHGLGAVEAGLVPLIIIWQSWGIEIYRLVRMSQPEHL